jgi:phosphoribosylformylglycinamidine synthase
MYTADIKIKLKKGVADPEGQNTKKALQLLGYAIEDVRTIKMFEIDFKSKNKKSARKEVEEMCRRLLANPVIHTYEISL